MAEGNNSDLSEFYDALPQANTDIDPKTFDSAREKPDLQESLSSLGLNQENIQFVLKQGEKYLKNPDILAKKLKISKDVSREVVDILKSSKQISLTPDDIETIKTCLEDNPDLETYEDIALMCEIDEEIVSKYFEQIPLTAKQKKLIQEHYNMEHPINDISKLLDITKVKVSDYVEATFVTFSGENGKIVFDIITQYCGEMLISSLRQKIQSRDLKLQNQLCCVLSSENKSNYDTVSQYLSRFEESKDFLKIDTSLTIHDINIIKQSSNESIEQISSKLKKIEGVISQYLKLYFLDPVEDKHKTELQENQILDIIKTFGTKLFSLDNYRERFLLIHLNTLLVTLKAWKQSAKQISWLNYYL